MNIPLKPIFSSLVLFGLGVYPAAAQASEKIDLSPDEMMTAIALILFGFTLVFAFVLILLLLKLRSRLLDMMPKTEADILAEERTFLEKLFQVPHASTQKSLLMSHSYDGIQELDNPTPPWFMFLFYSTIFFSVVYGIIYHGMGDGRIMENEYAVAMQEAEVQRAAYLKKYANAINESNVTLVTEKEKLEEGKSLYMSNCVACHGPAGEGKVGPNLTDAYWIHGGGISDVFKTVSEGVPEKGMVPWKKQMNPLQIQLVASYVLSLKGTNPPNAKEPQGQLLEDGAKPAEAPKDSVASTATSSL